MAKITTLIDKQDNFEQIAIKIGDILKTEAAAQVVLANGAGKDDPQEWDLQVFVNRSNPWEKWISAEDPDSGSGADKLKVPIVNIWFDSDSNNPNAGNNTETTQRRGTFNIDCYGYGIAKDDGGSGHIAGDKMASDMVWRAARLVRNILISEPYKYLDLRGTVGKRSVLSRTYFQPQQTGIFVQNVIGLRIALDVYFIENAPTSGTEILELIATEMTVDNEINLKVEQEFPSSP